MNPSADRTENDRLRAENLELKVGKAGLHAENAGLRAEVERLRAGDEPRAYSRFFPDSDTFGLAAWVGQVRSALGNPARITVTARYDRAQSGHVVTVEGGPR